MQQRNIKRVFARGTDAPTEVLYRAPCFYGPHDIKVRVGPTGAIEDLTIDCVADLLAADATTRLTGHVTCQDFVKAVNSVPLVLWGTDTWQAALIYVTCNNPDKEMITVHMSRVWRGLNAGGRILGSMVPNPDGSPTTATFDTSTLGPMGNGPVFFHCPDVPVETDIEMHAQRYRTEVVE